MGRVTGKVVLVTGAGRGMGRSHAVRLAEEGADLVLVDVCAPVDGIGYPMSTPEDLAETVRLVETFGRRVVADQADVRDLDGLQHVVDEAVAVTGGLDAAVANAGVLTYGAWDAVTHADWRTVLDINLTGVWHTFRAAIPHLLSRGGGSLVAISSAAGIKGNPLTLPYTTAKHGLTGLTLGLANELAAQSIRVNSVHPTGVPTGLQVPGLLELLGGPRADLAPIYQNALPVDMIEPVDVSNAVLYLVSDEARFVTGLQLKVDAGVGIR
jgi:SDR family mycofactocin-dependent oxidoreductase